MVGRILKGITKHCYIQNIKALGLMVSEKKSFFYVLPIVSLWDLTTLGYSQFGPLGHDWHGLCRVTLNIATY